MRTVIAVARRELAARRAAWPVALAMGFVPFLVPLVIADATEAAQTPADMAMGMFMGSWLAPLLVGLSLLGPDLAEARGIRFWLARPVGPAAVVAGKLVAGVILGLGAQLLTLAPAMLRYGPPLPSAYTLTVYVLLALLLLAIGVVTGVVARSGSRWAVVDLVGFITVVLIAVRVLSRPAAPAAPIGAIIAAVAAMVAAVVVGLVRGRIDRVRVHHALSATLWPALLPAVVLLLL
jgi:hypothetical protein